MNIYRPNPKVQAKIIELHVSNKDLAVRRLNNYLEGVDLDVFDFSIELNNGYYQALIKFRKWT